MARRAHEKRNKTRGMVHFTTAGTRGDLVVTIAGPMLCVVPRAPDGTPATRGSSGTSTLRQNPMQNVSMELPRW